jgi:hypothetical protein
LARLACVALLTTSVIATACGPTQTANGGTSLGGSIIIGRGEVARDDLTAVLADVRVDGRATGDIVVIGGRLVVNGEVEQSVSCYGGTLVLGPGARVGRDVRVMSADLQRSDSARIGGELVNVSVGSVAVPLGAVAFLLLLLFGFGIRKLIVGLSSTNSGMYVLGALMGVFLGAIAAILAQPIPVGLPTSGLIVVVFGALAGTGIAHLVVLARR